MRSLPCPFPGGARRRASNIGNWTSDSAAEAAAGRERERGGEKIGEWKENRHKEVRGAEQNAVRGVKTVNLVETYTNGLFGLSGCRVEVDMFCTKLSYS